MAEKIVSPGVFSNEIDQTFLPSAVADIGAALIGPTVKGPALIPTVVTSYADFQNKFGDVFKSGSNSYQYLTSHTAEQYLKNANTLTVVRILDGSYSGASTIVSSSADTSGLTFGSSSITLGAQLPSASAMELTIGGVDFMPVISKSIHDAGENERYVNISTTVDLFGANLRDEINAATIAGYTAVSASYTDGSNLLSLSGSSVGTVGNITVTTSSIAENDQAVFGPMAGTLGYSLQGGTDASSAGTSFKLHTFSDGTIMNNADTTARTNNLLQSGSKHNLRWEVSNVNVNKGTFTLIIRSGEDTHNRKQILETYTNISLDPNATNFIGKAIGDQVQTFRTDSGTNGKFLQLSGSYPRKSNYVYVSNIETTIDYLDENGNIRVNSLSQSLPAAGSGSSNGGFSGGSDGRSGFDSLGNQNGSLGSTAVNFYENITDTNSQGFDLSDASNANGGSSYTDALDLLANQDEYDINLILAPGIISKEHTAIASKIVNTCEDRGDCFAILDPVKYGTEVNTVTAEAVTRDSNYAAIYWPWVKVNDTQVGGTQRWVPPSVVLGGIFAFNDRVAQPWFAPAGLNRGGIDVAIQAERKLTQTDRDTLYDSNVNPIATFPGQGVTVFGQKTLQKKSTALDRINVRRLLIKVKKFIASSSRFLVFEQNTAATRRRFLSIANPFLDQVQQQSGLNAFRVVMDDSNNTPDTIDRNQLVGQIFLQPTRTAEFIVLDFTVQPTGATFPE